jgi:Bifunctional DNA primase/polymerase, N-terminal/Protein of unknown function (DUF3987)
VNVLDTALGYIERGWRPIPVPAGTKSPVIKGWPELHIRADDATSYFANECNVGVILGNASGGLVDVDLDCPEALEAAPYFLPATPATFGRKSKRASHWLYKTDVASIDGRATIKFADPVSKSTLLELRTGGDSAAQTIFPGSTHPSGEAIQWENGAGHPSPVQADDLIRAVNRTAAATLLSRYWPSEGSRHVASLRLGGFLARAGLNNGEIKVFVQAVARSAHDEEWRDRMRAACDGADAQERCGFPSLKECFGEPVAKSVATWMGYGVGEAGTEDDATLVLADAGREPGKAEGPHHGTDSWPEPLGEDAYYGLAGDVVRTLAPHTESDPAAILLQFLAAAGNALGRSRFYQVEGDRHPPQIWPVLVGETAKARKGTSLGRIRSVFERVAPEWAEKRFASGLSSGEGLIWQVRDPIEQLVLDKKTRKSSMEVTDAGVDDKRLFVVENEFASPLRHFERQGNTLSSTLRALWDSGRFASLTKNSPARTTGAMVTVVGHITKDELGRYLTRTEMGNGLANRFIFVCVRRSQLLPFGGGDVDLDPLMRRLSDVLSPAGSEFRVDWDTDAVPIWQEVYPRLSEGQHGMLGAVTSRAEAQVVRIALIYALLDKSSVISAPHLRAALAVWQYCLESARVVFGNATGDVLADDLLEMLRDAPDGLSRGAIHNKLGHHKSREQINGALARLKGEGLANSEKLSTGGRSKERWFLL